MNKEDVATWDVGEATRQACESLSIKDIAREIIMNIPSDKRSLFIIEANAAVVNEAIK